MQVVEKVTAFVTREGANGRELLIFRHPLNGLQLPAGTVEVGESPETAESWTVFVDGHHFELFWTPLRPVPSLVWPQSGWLTAVCQQLAVGIL